MKNLIRISCHFLVPDPVIPLTGHRGITSLLVSALQFQTITSTFRLLPDQARNRGDVIHMDKH